MKVSTLILSAIFLGSSIAFAGPQTTDCASNMTQLKDLIRSKFPEISANYANRFVGTWKKVDNESITLSVSPSSAFQFKVCPQHDGSFYVNAEGNGGAKFKLTGKGAKVYAASGMLAAIAGDYSRNTELARK